MKQEWAPGQGRTRRFLQGGPGRELDRSDRALKRLWGREESRVAGAEWRKERATGTEAGEVAGCWCEGC